MKGGPGMDLGELAELISAVAELALALVTVLGFVVSLHRDDE